jgi:hypothetical protein
MIAVRGEREHAQCWRASSASKPVFVGLRRLP